MTQAPTDSFAVPLIVIVHPGRAVRAVAHVEELRGTNCDFVWYFRHKGRFGGRRPIDEEGVTWMRSDSPVNSEEAEALRAAAMLSGLLARHDGVAAFFSLADAQPRYNNCPRHTERFRPVPRRDVTRVGRRR